MPAMVTPNSQSVDIATSPVLTRPVDGHHYHKNPLMIRMSCSEMDTARLCNVHTISLPSTNGGLRGGAVRASPNQADSSGLFLPSVIKWARTPSPVAELQAR